MKVELEAMGLEVPEVEGHPNRLAFHGVLTVVAAPSRRAPGGAQGHRVMLTRKATEAALPSLLGMALDYVPGLDGHDQQRKVGLITEAEIVAMRPQSADPASEVRVSGFVYEHDFPEVAQALRGSNGSLGMSYEITQAEIISKASPIWTVTRFTFTGAAVLRREKAAYPETRFVISNKQ